MADWYGYPRFDPGQPLPTVAESFYGETRED